MKDSLRTAFFEHLERTLGLVLMAAAASGGGCSTSGTTDRRDAEATASAPAVRSPEAVAEWPVEVVPVDVPADIPAYYLRGKRGTTARMVFLHGRCTHAQGYVQSFAFAAAKRGSVVAPQGDIACDGALRRWKPDPELQNRRIEAAFRAVGVEGELKDLLVIGYSQGEILAEHLVERFPERYTRAVLIGAPAVPPVSRLRGLRGAVMMSGELDAKELMREGAKRLLAVGVPTTYVEMPRARHAQITEGERTMEDVFAWLETNARAASP